MNRQKSSIIKVVGIVLASFATKFAHAQIEITEIMFDPIAEGAWEWVEIRNTTSTAVDLDNWIFDDDDDSSVPAPNISAVNGNTVVPAGGVAVLYNGTDLTFDSARFTSAWGGGINLIPVSKLTSLTPDDTIGLWNSQESYETDDLNSTSAPRRTFNSTVASVNFAPTNGFPATSPSTNGRSIAWKGTGSIAQGASWLLSSNGGLGAHVSVQTTLPGGSINSTADRGTPGTVPGGGAASGLVISEIMYDPASPEPGWEWVEIFNNTGSAIDFGATPYVFDDDDDGPLPSPNIAAGTIAQGAVGVLYNAGANGASLPDMQAAWGAGINFIPVSAWTDITNSGDTIAIWSSYAAYSTETDPADTPRRTTDNAAITVTFDDSATAGWPAKNNAASIFMPNLTSNPSEGTSWSRSNDTNSLGPQPVLAEVVDHPGGDTGSPGYVPGVATPLQGDLNGNSVVDAADYVIWRNNAGSTSDYNLWRANFGKTAAGGSTANAATVPEPSSLAILAITLLIAKFTFSPRPMAGGRRNV
jgi:hypothetical protein